jgi:hypothetical protein
VDQTTTEEFAAFYRQFRARCLRAVYASVGDRQLLEDLVSEGFARAWASWRKSVAIRRRRHGSCVQRSTRTSRGGAGIGGKSRGTTWTSLIARP